MKLSKIVKRLRYRVLIVFAVVSILIVCGMALIHNWEVKRGEFPEHSFGDDTIVYDGKEYTKNKSVETFLLIGLDKFSDKEAIVDSYNNDKQADFLMLFVFDNEKQQYSAIQINRDTMASVNVLGVAGDKIGSTTTQIALSHTYGNGREVSCNNTAEAVSSVLLGAKVNHYASITMDAVAIVNDLVGGVEVEVLDDFSGIDDTLIKGETVKLMGEHALNYVRTRYGLDDSSNASRMKRQQQYITAFKAALETALENNTDLVLEISLKTADHIVSDRSANQLQTLANKISDYEFKGIVQLEGESRKGEKYMEFHPDKDFVEKLVIESFYKEK